MSFKMPCTCKEFLAARKKARAAAEATAAAEGSQHVQPVSHPPPHKPKGIAKSAKVDAPKKRQSGPKRKKSKRKLRKRIALMTKSEIEEALARYKRKRENEQAILVQRDNNIHQKVTSSS